MSRYPLEGYRERCDTDVVLGDRFASRPIELAIPITVAGMSFGALGANAKEAIGRACTAMGTSSTTGDGGMTEEERQSSETLVYQVPAVALRNEPRRSAPGGCDRGGRGPGRQAGRRRHAARPEDHRAGGRDARSSGRHRPAQRLPPSRLDGARRPRDQDPGAPRDHRLGEARLHQDRRLQAAIRRAARRQVGRRRGRSRRHAGRHRGDPGRLHRACRHSDAARRPPGGRGAAGARHAPQGATHRVGRHQDRRRRRQGARAGGGRGIDRLGGDGRARLQPPGPCRGLPRHRDRAPAPATTATPAVARSA